MSATLEVLAIQARQLQRAVGQLESQISSLQNETARGSLGYLTSAALLLGVVASRIECMVKWAEEDAKRKQATVPPQDGAA